MLKINGNEVIFSTSFLMAKGDNVVLAVPEAPGFSVVIVSEKFESEWPPGAPSFIARHLVNQIIGEVPFVQGAADFDTEFRSPQFLSAKGPLNCRVSGHRAGSRMLVHVDIHQLAL